MEDATASSTASDAMDVVQEWAHLTESMEIDEAMDVNMSKRYLALDTNVLISGLNVLQEFSEFVESQHLEVEFLIAGIVVEELDGLKRRGSGSKDHHSGQDVSRAARAASDWLLSGLRRRSRVGHGHIRGQAYHQTRQPTGNWKSRESGENNDQLILDCCLFFSSKRKVYLLTMDKNFGNQSLMNDIPIVLYERGWNYLRLYAAMTPELQDTAYGSIHVSTRQFAKKQPTYAQPQPRVDDSMMVDDDASKHAPLIAQHPMDAAHLEVCGLALPLLRKAAFSVVQVERERLLRGGRDASIHSRSRNDGFSSVRQLPDEEALAVATVKECLVLLWRLTKASKAYNSLVPFLLPAGERGARRGREFSRGDWEAGGRELLRVGNDSHDDALIKLGNDIIAWVSLHH